MLRKLQEGRCQGCCQGSSSMLLGVFLNGEGRRL